MKDTDYSLQVNLPSRDKPLGMSEWMLCSHPKEILAAGLTITEKREILSSWASDARAVPDTPSLRTLDNGAVMGVHEILDALRVLDSLESPRTSPIKMNESRRRRGFLELLTATSRKDRSDDDDGVTRRSVQNRTPTG